MRVLSIIARMNVGGPAHILASLRDHLDAERYRQLLVVGGVGEGEEDWFRLRGQPSGDDRTLVVPSLGRAIAPHRDLAAYLHLRRIIRQLQPDIVHTHTAKAGLLGRTAAIREGVPGIVHTFHGHLLHGYFSPSTSRELARLERQLARRTSRLLVVGGRVRDELLDAGIGTPERYTLLEPGVPVPTAPDGDQARRQLGLDPSAPVVAFVGRLEDVKRPDRYLAVAQRVAAARPDTVFLVAGGGTAAQEAALRSRVGRAEVRFLGWVADVAAVYAAADVVTLTSDNEGMPVTLIEAGMSGTACVATNVGSVTEVVKDGQTGRVVPTATGPLADAVLELLGAPYLRAGMGAAAMEHTQARFSVDRMVSTVSGVYDELVP